MHHRTAQDQSAIAGSLRLLAEAAVHRVRGAQRWCWQVVQVTSTLEYTGTGTRWLRAGATLINMEFVQFHPTGMVWPPSVKENSWCTGVRGDGGVLKLGGSRFMFDYIPPVLSGPVRRDGGRGRPVKSRTTARPGARTCARRGRARDQLRGQGQPQYPARRRLPRHRISTAEIKQNCRRCITSSRSSLKSISQHRQ